jgi:hypothetical protein
MIRHAPVPTSFGRRELFKELQPPHEGLPLCRPPELDRWGGGVIAEEMREVQWVTPEIAVQVSFACVATQRFRGIAHLMQMHEPRFAIRPGPRRYNSFPTRRE